MCSTSEDSGPRQRERTEASVRKERSSRPRLEIPIAIAERSGIVRQNEFVSVGVPLPPARVWPGSYWDLAVNGQSLPVQVQPASMWPDGSIRWLRVGFFASLASSSEVVYCLTTSEYEASSPRPKLHVAEATDCWWIDTGKLRFRVSTKELLPPRPDAALPSQQGSFRFVDGAGGTGIARLSRTELLTHGSLSATLVQTGWIDCELEREAVRVRSALTFFAGETLVRWQVTLHNPRAASHPEGTWDLGDVASVRFRDFSIVLPCPNNAQYQLRPEAAAPWSPVSTESTIYQESSGGGNFRSANHRNRDGTVPHTLRGYIVDAGGRRLLDGFRASPTVHVAGDDSAVTARIRRFWEQWPKAIRFRADQIELALFPMEYPDVFELQPGESKTHELALTFDDGPDSLEWLDAPLVGMATSDTYRESGSFLGLGALAAEERFAHLLQAGLDQARGFFAKREVIDEFGWRHFGDVYADHEAKDKPAGSLISHYNNQYDLIFGLGRQFIETGDPRWLELHDDLARHVYDIDIYKTNDDKPEYNGGLFWHTDHYLDAGLSTHRTYSREQPKGSYQDHNRGGGPGAEHCYTRGLALHYHLTGNELSREACLTLVDWMENSFGERRGLLGWILQSARRDVPKLLEAARRRTVVRFQYPLTRATGNYLRALLDAFELTGNLGYLTKAASTIRQTAHPEERVELRDLLNVEIAWSYTVFLTAVGEFLRAKELLRELDEDFAYARDVLCTFADWMIQHERPYLEAPEVLEFPNHTWTAQDIRKASVLYYAWRYAPLDRPDYLAKARFFRDHAVRTLSEVDDHYQTRILAILLQNAESIGALHEDGGQLGAASPQRGVYDDPASHQLSTLLSVLARELWTQLRTFSLREEMRWIRARLR